MAVAALEHRALVEAPDQPHGGHGEQGEGAVGVAHAADEHVAGDQGVGAEARALATEREDAGDERDDRGQEDRSAGEPHHRRQHEAGQASQGKPQWHADSNPRRQRRFVVVQVGGQRAARDGGDASARGVQWKSTSSSG